MKRLRAEANDRARVAKEKERARVKKLDALPKSFDADGCGGSHAGGGTNAHIEARAACLERLRPRAPALSHAAQALWPQFKKWYTRWIGKQHKSHGVAFIREVNQVMFDLGPHFKAPPGGGKVPGEKNPKPDAKALEAWLWKQWSFAPKAIKSQTAVL